MAVSYNKLWKLLIDKGTNKTKLRNATNMSSSNIAERDIRVSDALKTVLKRWNDEYVADPVASVETAEPSTEQLAMIEEFKKKGWV